VRIFLAEKGIDLPETPVDMMAREHKSPSIGRAIRWARIADLGAGRRDGDLGDGGHLPLLREEQNRAPDVFGATAVEKALVDMWIRRAEVHGHEPVGNSGATPTRAPPPC